MESVLPFLVSLGIGVLIGLEREQAQTYVWAGIRTMPLLALLGTSTQTFLPQMLPWVFIGVAATALAGYAVKVWKTKDGGATTAIVMLVVFVLGAMAAHSYEAMRFAIVIGAATAVMLAVKGPAHAFASHIDKQERYAMAKFLVLALVILPLLPDRRLDALLGLNPRFVWSMVVFISAIDLVGYLLVRYWSARGGIGVTGILGGLVSSTAATVSLAGRARDDKSAVPVAAMAALAATLVSFPRVLVEVAVVNRAMLPVVAVPIGAMLLVGVLIVVWRLWRGRIETPDMELENPFRLAPALLFGGLFAAVLLLAEWLNDTLGAIGLYVTAVVGGLPAADAPTLSFSRLAGRGEIPAETATLAIIIALVSNLALKVGLGYARGGADFGNRLLGFSAVVGATGLAVALFV